LAIATCGENIEAAKRAASEAIRINLESYREAGQQAPDGQSVSSHLENPEFRDLLFAYVKVAEPQGRIAASRLTQTKATPGEAKAAPGRSDSKAARIVLEMRHVARCGAGRLDNPPQGTETAF
jgi:hypothetical protein